MRKIATLEVWQREESDWLQGIPEGSGYAPPRQSDDIHRILVDPTSDVRDFKNLGVIAPVEKLVPSTFAHELGHFVDYMTNGPLRQWAGIPMYIKPPSVTLSEERNAWQYANEMIAVDSDTQNTAMKSYEDILLPKGGL